MAASGVSLPQMVTKEGNSGGNTANEEHFIYSHQGRQILSFARIEQTHLNSPRVGKGPMATCIKQIRAPLTAVSFPTGKQDQMQRAIDVHIERAKKGDIATVATPTPHPWQCAG
eukprot:6954809-Ditylum_brightwellii.AAC.1